MNLRTLYRPRTRSSAPTTGAHRRPPATSRRPALLLSAAAAGALLVNVLAAGEPAAQADSQLESVSIAEQLGISGRLGPRPPVPRSPAPLEQLAASRAERDAEQAAAAEAQAAAEPGRAGRARGPETPPARSSPAVRQEAPRLPARSRPAGPPRPRPQPRLPSSERERAGAGRRTRRLLPGVRPGAARRGRQRVLLPREPVGQGERLEPERAEPDQHRVRDPAVPRLHLGRHRDRQDLGRLPADRRRADLHREPLRLAVRRLGPLAGQQLVLEGHRSSRPAPPTAPVGGAVACCDRMRPDGGAHRDVGLELRPLGRRAVPARHPAPGPAGALRRAASARSSSTPASTAGRGTRASRAGGAGCPRGSSWR